MTELKLTVPENLYGLHDLADAIGSRGVARLSGEDALERALRRYDQPGLKFLSADFRDRWLGETICIHGSGPSIDDTLPELLELVANGAKVCAVNAAHDWLIDRGIIPHFGIMADPKDWCADYQTPQAETMYLLNSGCHDDVFKRFKGHPRAFVWHALGAETAQTVERQAIEIAAKARATGKGAYMCQGGSTTFMRALDVFTHLGFRHQHHFGVDCSGTRRQNETVMHAHAKPYTSPSSDRPVHVKDYASGKELAHEFWSNGPMEHQALHWESVLRDRFDRMRDGSYPPVEIVVHGHGLWPAMAAVYGFHADQNYLSRLRAEGYLEPFPLATFPAFEPIQFADDIPEIHL